MTHINLGAIEVGGGGDGSGGGGVNVMQYFWDGTDERGLGAYTRSDS